jgi:hypothetical protein
MLNDGQAVRQLRRVVQRVSELEAATIGTEEIEPDLRKLVEIVEANPSDLVGLKKEFLRLVQEYPPGATEILQFVMHRYRWNEVKGAISARIASTQDRRLKPALERVLAAFDPEWEDRDIFSSYRDRK